MGTPVLSYSDVAEYYGDIDSITGADHAPALSNSEVPIENGDWQGESSSSLTPEVADMTPKFSPTDTENFLAQSYDSHFESVRGALPFYSSAPSSRDIYSSATNIEVEPVMAYSSSPTSTDGQGIISTAESLVYTDSTREAPMLMYSSSPAMSNFENGPNTIGTIPFYSSDPTAAIDSMSLVNRKAAVPSSSATEHEVLSYSLISDSVGIENEEAPFHNSGADDPSSKGPVGRSNSRPTEHLSTRTMMRKSRFLSILQPRLLMLVLRTRT